MWPSVNTTNKQSDKYSEFVFKYLRKILYKIVLEHNKNIQILLIEYVTNYKTAEHTCADENIGGLVFLVQSELKNFGFNNYSIVIL